MASYNYIICGGGTSGCVIAARLADSLDASVLLLEAGPDSAGLETVRMIGTWSDNFNADHDPLHVEPHDLAPIPQRIQASFVEGGLPLHPDMFSNGDTAVGCGHVLRTVHGGARSTVADYLTPRSRARRSK